MTETPRSITIEYPGTLPLALRKNKGNQSNWRNVAEETKNLREVGYALILEAIPDGLEDPWVGGFIFTKATVLVTQHWCGKPLDVSGLASASAPLVDAFMDAGVIEDDGPEVVVETRYGHVRVPHKPDRKIVITVTEASS